MDWNTIGPSLRRSLPDDSQGWDEAHQKNIPIHQSSVGSCRSEGTDLDANQALRDLWHIRDISLLPVIRISYPLPEASGSKLR